MLPLLAARSALRVPGLILRLCSLRLLGLVLRVRDPSALRLPGLVLRVREPEGAFPPIDALLPDRVLPPALGLAID